MTFQAICNLIVLIGAAVVAITNILKFIGRPAKFLKKRSKEEFKKNLEDILPEALEVHDKIQKEKYADDRKLILSEVRSIILEEIKPDIQQIINTNQEQNQKIEILNLSSKDILREKIMTIYERNKKNRCLYEYERRQLDQYYKDYKKENGNTYIDTYYNLMKDWDTIPDE